MTPGYSREGITFAYTDEGDGPAFIFQHGLGGDRAQPRGLWAGPGRLIAMDCRGHGETEPLGPVEQLSFTSFAADVAALLDHLGVEQAAVGGISMGAGVALRLAYEQPRRVQKLVLVRPAWFTTPAPPNLDSMIEIGGLLADHGSERALELFLATDTYRVARAESGFAAHSLLGQFARARAAERAPVLERLANDRPLPRQGPWPELSMPILVIATEADPLHPVSCAQAWADALPSARLEQVTSKTVDEARHAREVAAAIRLFLAEPCKH